VPGTYAWGVTVAPGAWARGASMSARMAAIAALAALAASVMAERRWGERARIVGVWAFVGACAVSWSAAPRGLSSFRVDAYRGLAGMLAWGLFAFASCAPVAPAHAANARRPSNSQPRGDMAYLACGALLAALFEGPGWGIESAERALLVRFVALAAGLAILGAATQVALVRRLPRSVVQGSVRLRRATAALVVLGLLGLAGLLGLLLD
jgi:hypothetical protein